MSDLTQLPLFNPIIVKMPRGFETIIDPIDADLAQFKWQVEETCGNVYARRYEHKGKVVRIHRIILSRILNRTLSSQEYCDHIDGNGLNNRRNNLRLATKAQNNRNRKINASSKSGYKGVDYKKNKWRARISDGQRSIHLGYFSTPEEAYAAYCEAAKEIHGEFARLK